jgi:hypothetical protein
VKNSHHRQDADATKKTRRLAALTLESKTL